MESRIERCACGVPLLPWRGGAHASRGRARRTRGEHLLETDMLFAASLLGDQAVASAIERGTQEGRAFANARGALREQRNRRYLAILMGAFAVVAVAFLVARHRHTRRLAHADAYARDQENEARLQRDKATEMEMFAARVAHDIRGPLSTASLSVEFLEDQEFTDAARPTLARLDRSIARAVAITDGLLEFARAGGRPEPGARTVLRPTIEETVEGLGPDFERARIHLEIDDVANVAVACSPGVFTSMLSNLLRNALKYMGDPPHKRVTIRATEIGETLGRVEVEDTGPGIPSGTVPHLFEPYFRAHGTTAAGLGLGLSTVRKLAEGHGGRVGVRSTLGTGSTFWFELPVER